MIRHYHLTHGPHSSLPVVPIRSFLDPESMPGSQDAFICHVSLVPSIQKNNSFFFIFHDLEIFEEAQASLWNVPQSVFDCFLMIYDLCRNSAGLFSVIHAGRHTVSLPYSLWCSLLSLQMESARFLYLLISH